jgi:hypothetical protein
VITSPRGHKVNFGHLSPNRSAQRAEDRRKPMLTVHVILSFIALLAGALVLISLCSGKRRPAWDAVLLSTTAFISLTGFPLASPPGTPTPDPARILGGIELGVVTVAALALYVNRLAHAWRGIYVVSIVLAVYLNVFVAATQAFLKIGFLHTVAPTGKEPPFLIAQVLVLALFVAIGVTAFRSLPSQKVSVVA